MIRTQLQEVIHCTNVEDVQDILGILNNSFKGSTVSQCLPVNELNLLGKLIEDLETEISNMTPEERELIADARKILMSEMKKLDSAQIDLCRVLHATECFHKSINTLEIKWGDIDLLRSTAWKFLSITTPKMQISNLHAISALSVNILNNITLRKIPGGVQTELLLDIEEKVWKIFSAVEFQIKNTFWLHKFKDEISKLEIKTAATTNNSPQRVPKSIDILQLSRNIDELKCEMNRWTPKAIVDNIDLLELNKMCLPKIEMLMQNIMSILNTERKYMFENHLFIDNQIPTMIGKNLRNYLAHGNILVNVLPLDPTVDLFISADKLITERIVGSGKCMDTLVKTDPYKLEQDYDENIRKIECQDDLFEALKQGNLNAVKNSLERGSDIYGRDSKLWTALHFASIASDIHMVKYVLKYQLYCEDKDVNGQNALHIAATEGRETSVEFFLSQRKMFVDAFDNNYCTPLHLAAQRGHSQIVEILLKFKASTRVKDVNGYSPIHYAIKNGHENSAMILLTRDENVDANVTDSGLTALHIAVEKCNLNFIEYLIQAGANVNTISDRFSTPLHLAVRRGNLKIVEFLILHGAKINAKRIDGTTPLHYAVLYGHLHVTKLLLKKGACTTAMDNIKKWTPLMFAFQNASCDMVDQLLNVNGNAINQKVLGMTHLHLAAKSGHNNAVLSFLRSNSHSTDYINIRDFSGFTALHLSVLCNRLDTTKLLLNKGADMKARDSDGCTPLIIAAEKGNVDLVQLLIHMKSELDSEAIGGMTALHFATLNQHEEIVDILIKSGANKFAKGVMGIAPLHIAVGTASKNIIEHFLTENNTANFIYGSFTILHLAALSKDTEIVDFITGKYSDVNSASESGFTPLHLAVKGNDINTINSLIGKQADVNLRDKYNHSPLYYAVRKNNVDVVRILIRKGTLVVDEGRGEPLTSAVLYGFENIVKILLKKGRFNLNILLKNKETFLHLATRNGFENIVKILLSHNNFQKAVNARTKKGITSLHLAALQGHINIIEILLQAGAKVGCKTSNNRTPLELAITRGHLHVVKYFLDQNVQGVNDRNSKGYTLLHIAAGAGKLDIVEYLLNKGANICVKADGGKKPIHIAAQEGHKDIVEYLIVKDPLHWNKVDDVNASPLVYAVIGNRLNVLKCILQNTNSDIINMKLSMDTTPLHLCVLFNLVDILKFLLENGACVTDTDAFHRKPGDINDQMRPVLKEIEKRKRINHILVCTEYLRNAIIDESIEDVRICILGEASVNAKIIQLTPLHYVAENGNEQIADILLEKNANPNILDADGLTPLHYSCDSSHIEIVKKLLSHGAIYNPLSTHNETPRDFARNLDIIHLLDLIENLFIKVEDPSSSVLSDISILDDVNTVKAVMNAKNRENKTIIISAIEHDFPEVNKLKEIFQGNIQNEYRLANIYYYLEKYEYQYGNSEMF
ncbi:Ankyrin-1 [Araneus ventricosus]|uniref:Ankyrin-1 n=1 Tax=Araneus ventricosus TaxID=182803 RepID=A0A4Y2C6X1_ARAVE|nr:Ankyrin-1 [Araneus ventricosus]